MLVRYSGSFAFALMISLSLFFAMQALISQPGEIIENPPDPLGFDFIAEPREIDEPIKNKLREPERPPAPPPVEEPDLSVNTGEPGGIPRPELPPVDPGRDKTVSLVMAGQQPMPQITLAPQYPTRMAQMGIEGHVDVGFDINKLGKPVNIRVLESTHRAFESAALEALEKWRYRPVVVNGEPQPFYGLRKRFSFQLDD